MVITALETCQYHSYILIAKDKENHISFSIIQRGVGSTITDNHPTTENWSTTSLKERKVQGYGPTYNLLTERKRTSTTETAESTARTSTSLKSLKSSSAVWLGTTLSSITYMIVCKNTSARWRGEYIWTKLVSFVTKSFEHNI